MSMGFVKSAYIKEISGGNKMFKKLKDKKGFTLVELIVVLVILAILAALLIPALTGYIDKARKEAVVAETRSAVMAAQTIVSEKYGTAKGDVTVADGDYTDIKNLAEVPGTITDIVVDQVTGSDNKGAVTKLTYTSADGKYTCYYYDKTYNWKAKA